MANLDAKFYEQKKQGTFYTAVWFFLIVVFLTGGLYFYKTKLVSQQDELQKKIEIISGSITDIENDPNIQIYSMYESNKLLFQKLDEYSQIPTFVAHLKKYFAKYDIEAKGFDYQNGSVTINLSSETNERGFAYQKNSNIYKRI